jgi:hypothetical protein
MVAGHKNRSLRSVESLIRKGRRLDVTSASVCKSLSPARTAHRSIGVVVDRHVMMYRSPSTTLPELLHKAGSKLDSNILEDYTASFQKNFFRTLIILATRGSDALLVIDTDGPRDWSHSDWRLLDVCFTDMRLEADARRAMMECWATRTQSTIRGYLWSLFRSTRHGHFTVLEQCYSNPFCVANLAMLDA